MGCIELREQRGGKRRRDRNQTENHSQWPKHFNALLLTQEDAKNNPEAQWDLSRTSYRQVQLTL
jgi:hypothetical protein